MTAVPRSSIPGVRLYLRWTSCDNRVSAFSVKHYFGHGKEEGQAEGWAEGRAQMLLALLASRFGPLTEATQVRVRGAPDAQLDAVAERIFTAQTLEEALS